MTWAIEWAEEAAKEFRKLNPTMQKTTRNYLITRIATAENPRDFGKPLQRNLAGLWRYRIGYHRVICKIQDNRMTVLVLRVAHRRHSYNRRNHV